MSLFLFMDGKVYRDSNRIYSLPQLFKYVVFQELSFRQTADFFLLALLQCLLTMSLETCMILSLPQLLYHLQNMHIKPSLV